MLYVTVTVTVTTSYNTKEEWYHTSYNKYDLSYLE